MTRALLILLAGCVTAAAESRYTDAMYRKAILDDSTSPLYVLFTLHDNKTGADRTVCTGGNFLLGAIHMEYRLDYDARGMKRGSISRSSSQDIASHLKTAKLSRTLILTTHRRCLPKRGSASLACHRGSCATLPKAVRLISYVIAVAM